MSVSLSNFIDTKTIDNYLVEKEMESDSKYNDEKTPRHSDNGQVKYLQKT